MCARTWIHMDEDNDVRDFLNRIQLLITNAGRDLHLLCDIGSSEQDRVTYDTLQEIWLLKPDMILFLRLLPKFVRAFGVVPSADEIPARYIESLVDNLEFLLNYKADFVAPVKEKLEVIKGILKILKGFLPFMLNNSNFDSNEFNNLCNHFTVVVKKLSCCIALLCLADELDEDMADCISFMMIDLLESIQHAKSDIRSYVAGLKLLHTTIEFTRELDVFAVVFVHFILEAPMTKLNSWSYLPVYNDLVQKLQISLRLLLIYILCCGIHNESLTIFDLVVNEFWSFINSLDNREPNEDLGKEFDLAISRLVQKMEPMASKILKGTIEKQKPALSFSQIDSLGCIDLVSQNLLRLLDHRIDSIAPVAHQIEVVLFDIKNFRPFLEGNVDQQGERKEVLDVCKHMTNLFVKFECVVDKFVLYPSSIWNNHLDNVTEEIKHFKKIVEFSQIYMGKKDVPSDCQTSKPSTPTIDEAVVGLEDQIEILMVRVIRGGAELKTIPIFGMPGIGKTTLAKRIYNDRRISDHFDIQAWCSVSPGHKVSELAQDILISIVDLSSDTYKSKEGKGLEYLDRLRKQLHSGRYLIVLDEVWNSHIFDELHRCFPDNHNGSRILVTSGRKYEDPLFDEPLLVRLLTPEESWELLQVKYNHLRFCTQEEFRKPPIPNENCPAEVGKEIAVKCQGLPLAIVLVAGFLVNLEDNSDWLTITEEAFSSETNRDVGDCNEIIELSYKNMPGYLRQCFLYFAALPMSTEISVLKLTWLWVSEGFLRRDEVKKPEEVAEDYLNDLMGRSLVMEARRSSKGGLKSCRIHNYLYHFCQDKSKVEKFLPVASRFEAFFLDTPFIPLTRTKIYSSERRRPSPLPKSIFRGVDHVRVLDLGCINIGNTFHPEIERLVHLRFLSLQGDMTVIPSWISKLWNLETFLVKGREGEIALPDTFFSMKRLRHAHIDNFTFSDSNLSQLDCLQTLSTPSLSYDTGNIMRSYPSLQKLKCIFLESWGHSEKLGESCYRFPVLDFLNQLESLNVIYQGRVLLPCEFNFPSNLKKLTLSKFRLPWVEISAISALPNLEVLKLLSEAFEGGEWNVSDEEFAKLKFLKLGNLNITLWNISDDAFPSLEHIVLQNCKQLIEIPSEFGDSCSLQKIEVFMCGESVSQSARNIEESQQDNGKGKFKVTIQNPNPIRD
ncbi:putative late blight resistance protein homolog R1A-3 isoform X3 [Nicotiana tomentosiformis]|uniref:putative late blight resistance protein homolog R1A-3 isoform X3 n=1 Tax=Nicotiana tomentosiformis TaxID=4098 RepID=UPI000877ECD6|nr:putative late blight resistance protein homolog R1B-12 isoform X2 [Nicotiana tomentosiformis]XP_018630558.1 putative late blight resistance protein homolog R1B-12 isoform X2 [Nicotiana tomentosiformis]XP_018630560.1 putative late blight resistance protein homolog R1B-12 isoform X2 [Nicotiana tomentosiformis]XP_018630561.1 putative late blight resistance protein homolog R1B-12 isoform X2 [Nicotiana tomentosiformis]XP_018630562.1 putative late blight resistance protein homolog R1B-12 isoform X